MIDRAGATYPKFPFFFLLALPLLHLSPEMKGAEDSIHVRASSPEAVAQEPGSLVTGGFVIENRGPEEVTVLIEEELPEGWATVGLEEGPIRLAPRSEHLRLLAIRIPSAATAGQYHVGARVRSEEGSLLGETLVPVEVLPVRNLNVSVEQRPRSAIAGEEVTVRFLLQNRGNIPLDLRVDIERVPEGAIRADPARLRLEPREQQQVQVSFPTDPALRQRTLHTIRSRIQDEAEGLPVHEETTSIDVIARVTGDPDVYHRIPARLRLSALADSENGVGAQGEFSAAGPLDESGRRQLDLLLRGPDQRGPGAVGSYEEYRVSLYDPQWDVHAGDQIYSLSPLLQQFRFGRGMAANLRREEGGVGAVLVQERPGSPEFRETGAYARARATSRLDVKVNALHRKAEAVAETAELAGRLYSAEALLDAGNVLQLDVEYGLNEAASSAEGRTGHRAEARGHTEGGLNYRAGRIYAEPSFAGTWNDADYRYGSVNFPIYRSLRGMYGYRNYRSNLLRDPDRRRTAPHERSHNGGLSYAFPFQATAMVEVRRTEREDLLRPSDYRENAVRLTWMQTYRRMHGRVTAERAVARDDAAGLSDSGIERYSAHLRYRHSPRQSYSGFVSTGQNALRLPAERFTSGGVTASWRFTDNITTHLNYGEYHSEIADRLRRQRHISATAAVALPNDHLLEVEAREYRVRGGGERFHAGAVRYSIPIDMPVGKRRSVGAIRGRLVNGDHPDRPPLPNAAIASNGATAVTAADGTFLFPGLRPGLHSLRVELDTVPPGMLTEQPGPYLVEVEAGEETEIEMALQTAAAISGQVHLVPEEDDKPAPLADALVTARSGTESYQQYTDSRGTFRFTHLRPGQWEILIDRGSLPPRHQVEDQPFRLELEPAGEEKLTVKVAPRPRRIIILEEEELE